MADLYDTPTKSATLTKACAELDRAVERCYRPALSGSDRERIEHLFRLHETLPVPLLLASPRTRSLRSKTPAAPPRPSRGRTAGLPAAER